MTWTDVTAGLPTLVADPGSWPKSIPVLVFDGIDIGVAYFEQIDDDCLPQWRSACSEGWELKHVQAWHPLPPKPPRR